MEGNLHRYVNVATHPGYSVVEIERPPVNVLNLEVLKELEEVFGEVAASSARAMLLQGAGKCFSAGADVGEHLPGKVEAMLPQFSRTIVALLGMEIPTTAYVHGAAMGGGLELALACDFIVAAEDAKMGLPEITLGVFPPVAAALLPDQIGIRRALELLCTGDIVNRRAALEMGLINIFGNAEEAVKYVEKMAAYPRPALVACKRATRVEAGGRIAEAERIYLKELMTHPEPEEGLRAFLEKRKPAWKDPSWTGSSSR